MELKAGYKQTEAGVIPWDWDAKPLQAVCAEKITYGIVQCGPHIENGIPYIRVSDMNSPELDVSSMLRTSPAIASSFSRSRVNEGDVVYALRGKLGEVRRVNSAVAGANLTQGTARIAPNKQVDGSYLLWSLRSQSALRQVELEAKGSTFREITLANLRAIEIAVPPILEQQAIAEALSDTDALIESLDQLIAKKRQIKQGSMQELLTGKRRLQGFGGQWEVKRLSELADVCKGSGLSKSLVSSSGSFKCILYGELFTTYSRIIRTTQNRTNSSDGEIGKPGDILLPGSTTTSGVDLAVASALLDEDVMLGGDINIVRKKHPEAFHSVFMAYFLTHTQRNAIADMAQGSTIIHLYGRDLLRLKLKLPSTNEQASIATVLEEMDTELAALEARLTKAHQIKQGMMQELLTGRIRLL